MFTGSDLSEPYGQYAFRSETTFIRGEGEFMSMRKLDLLLRKNTPWIFDIRQYFGKLAVR